MARSRRRSYLPALQALVVVAVVIAALDAAASLVEALTTDRVYGLSTPLSSDDVRELVPSSVVISKAQAFVDAPTGLGFRLAWWLTGRGSSLLVVVGGLVLRMVIATARAGDPFVAANVRRIRLLAALTLGHGLLTLLRSGVEVAIQNEIGAEHVSTTVSGSVQFISALVLFSLAEIWQRGVELRQEQELTV